MTNNIKHQIAIIAVVAVIFGLAGGVTGEIFARVYLLKDIFNIPLFGELNLGNGGGPSLIIRDAKNVVVEQNAQIENVAGDVKNSLVAIFNKKIAKTVALTAKTNKANSASSTNLDDYYLLEKTAGQGFIITSDGWIITSFLPPALAPGNAKPVEGVKIKDVISGYVIITNDRKIYDVDNFLYDSLTGYSFWHINARDLNVKSFAPDNNIKSGESVVAINWNNWIWPANITAVINRQTGQPQSSDACLEEITLDNQPSENFRGSFLFSLNSELVGFIDNNGHVLPIFNFTAVINGLLKNKTISRAKLGVNYIDLADAWDGVSLIAKGALIMPDKNGIAIVKNSLAEKIGLKAGDIIIAVDNVEIDAGHDLCSLIGNYNIGDETTITYSRNGANKELKIKF